MANDAASWSSVEDTMTIPTLSVGGKPTTIYNPTPFVYPTTTSAPTSVSTPRVSGAGINFPAANAAASTVS
ncbi:hypothetical protein FRB99_002693, partial [Tulasnella sp. 403]